MIELIYVSRASKRFTNEELAEMLVNFRKNNEKVNISGLFLYDGRGTFIQALEGESETVHDLLNSIRKDTRHSRLNILGERVIKERSYAEWSMGFKNLQDSPARNLQGFSTFLEQSERTEYLSNNPSFSSQLLSYFKNNNKLKVVEG